MWELNDLLVLFLVVMGLVVYRLQQFGRWAGKNPKQAVGLLQILTFFLRC